VTMAAHARSCVEAFLPSSMFMHKATIRGAVLYTDRLEECLVTHKQSLLPNWQATVDLLMCNGKTVRSPGSQPGQCAGT
jgi:hypothetical protein